MLTEVEISRKAWTLRENGDVEEALILWMQNYFTYTEKGGWNNVINTLFDMSIAWKILGGLKEKKEYFRVSLNALEHARFISDMYSIPLRDDWYFYKGEVQVAAGDYSEAIRNYEMRLSFVTTENERANMNAHIGFAKAMTGDRKEGIRMIKNAIAYFEQTEDDTFQDKSIRDIWKTGALLKLAQVLMDDDRTKAQDIVVKVLQEAQEKGLGARVKQAENLITKI